jgi:flagellar hook-basal body complex protein FliE
MNKLSQTGLNFISRNVKENIDQTKTIQKQIVNIQQEVLNESNTAGKSFINNVSDALDDVAKAQSDAAEVTKNYEIGKEQDLTKVIVNQQLSKLAFQLTLNVRNKVLSAYKDIMNMPV